MVESILSATPFGPVFKHESVTLRQVREIFDFCILKHISNFFSETQALKLNISERRFKFLGTFMPDELVTLVHEKKNFTSYDNATILLVNISGVFLKIMSLKKLFYKNLTENLLF